MLSPDSRLTPDSPGAFAEWRSPTTKLVDIRAYSNPRPAAYADIWGAENNNAGLNEASYRSESAHKIPCRELEPIEEGQSHGGPQ
jgi:hypothetical protein